MFQTVRFIDSENTVDAQAVVIDGLIYLFEVHTGTLTPAICKRSIRRYGLNLTQFTNYLHLHGIKGAMQNYPHAFINLGRNQYVTTKILDHNFVIHEN